MAAQIGRVEAIMHQEGGQIPWLEQDAQSSPIGDRSSNISMEPAIYFTIMLKDGKTQVIDVELFVVRAPDNMRLLRKYGFDVMNVSLISSLLIMYINVMILSISNC